MKKILFPFLLCLSITSLSYSQPVRINFSLFNHHVENGLYAVDVRCTVLTAQLWRVGSSNLRYDITTIPATGVVTVHPDNPDSGLNVNLSPPSCLGTNSNYGCMTTTSISGGTAISLNITRLNNCYYLTPGVYTLGRLRFNRIDTTGCVRLTMRTTSVIQDSITQWFNPADWTITQDTSCRLITGIGTSPNEIPNTFALYQNFPNPFNPVTTIKFDIAKTSGVKLIIYDVLGKEIARLLDERKQPGKYEIQWDGKNFSSGTYIYKLEAGDFTDIKKMILVK